MTDILSSSDYDPNVVSPVLKRVVDTLNAAHMTETKPTTVVVTAPAASQGNWNDISTAFSGDFSKCSYALSYTISGATTLGQPSSGYRFNPELDPIAIYVKNLSGWNQGTADNSGRTSVSAARIKVDNYGQGDAVCLSVQGFVSGAKLGATSFLANPAAILINGGTFAGQAGVYLNPVEINTDDQGFDVGAVNFVANQNRSVNTGALGAYWTGFRSQSKGSKAIDHHFYGSGPAVTGVDFSLATLTNVFKLASGNRPTVTGSRGGNAALASLLTGLATLGLITDSTSA